MKTLGIMNLHINSIFIAYLWLQFSVIWTLPTKELIDYQAANQSTAINHTEINDDSPSTDPSDTMAASATHQLQTTKLPITLQSPDLLASSEKIQSTSQEPLTPAAQNYFSSFFRPSIPPLGHSRPYYQPTEEPFFSKFLNQQHHKQFLPQLRQQPLAQYDASILGSGDFGILRGGTFYSDEDQSYHQEDNTDFFYSEASNAHSGPATEGFIQKYTYPEEQFAEFRDFADLNTPSETAYSQYVVVYAAHNSTGSLVNRKLPNNIFDQLQQIDAEKAAEERKMKKTSQGLSTSKRKLVRTKIMKKKWDKKSNSKVIDDDPLLALS